MVRPMGTIYFLRRPDGAIKIGFTRAPTASARVRTAQTYHDVELEVLAEAPGSEATDRRLRERFVRFRTRGEWFEPARELMELIHAIHDGVRPDDYLA